MDLIRGIYKILDSQRFTLKSYGEFLDRISSHKIVPLREMDWTFDPDKVVIGLKHDIDRDLVAAVRMATIEYKKGIRGTYFVLHTALYYKRKSTIPVLKAIQDMGFEIGFHNNLQAINFEKYSPDELKHKLRLNEMRDAGIKLFGTSAHGNGRHGLEGDNLGAWSILPKESLGFIYEAYSLNYNRTYSDCLFTDKRRNHPDDIDPLEPGDRIMMLFHPQHWKK